MQTAIDEALNSLFHSLRARGRIRQGLEIDVLVRVFKTLHFGLSAVWTNADAGARGVDELCAESLRLFCRGLEK